MRYDSCTLHPSKFWSDGCGGACLMVRESGAITYVIPLFSLVMRLWQDLCNTCVMKKKTTNHQYGEYTLVIVHGSPVPGDSRPTISQVRVTHPNLEYGVPCLDIPTAKQYCDRNSERLTKKGAMSKAQKQLAESNAMSIQSDLEDALMKKNLA